MKKIITIAIIVCISVSVLGVCAITLANTRYSCLVEIEDDYELMAIYAIDEFGSDYIARIDWDRTDDEYIGYDMYDSEGSLKYVGSMLRDTYMNRYESMTYLELCERLTDK